MHPTCCRRAAGSGREQVAGETTWVGLCAQRPGKAILDPRSTNGLRIELSVGRFCIFRYVAHNHLNMSQRIIVGAFVWLVVAGAAADSDIQSLTTRYLAATGDKKEQLSKEIRRHSGSIESVINRLKEAQPRSHRDSAGTHLDEHFTAAELRDTYSDDLINFLVPDGYSVDQSFGLLIFMHGGGPGTKREYARSVISDPAKDRYSYGLRRHFTNSQFIVVAPSAPWNDKSSARWNLPEADAYIDAVIRECNYRCHIDPNRVFLGGQSMGGFGAYHLCQRLADRLAGGNPICRCLAIGTMGEHAWHAPVHSTRNQRCPTRRRVR